MNKSLLKDHRQIGQELDLFSFHDVAPGAVFWHPKGWKIYLELQKFLRERLVEDGYQEISSPVMVKSSLFKKSGHWEHFGEHNMFNLVIDEEQWSLKPMNCPESALIYSSRIRSYNDLPMRLSDFGILHRRELSGVLGGLLRVQQFTIDDAHHFVRPDQIQKEIRELLVLVSGFYKSFGFIPEFYLATKPDKAMGETKLWEEAEKGLKVALGASKVKYKVKEKDGAFYGPKIDIHIKDSQGRDWQLATIQLDFQIPEKMELEYIDKNGKTSRPVIIHRAILGSLERFIGILLEHYQGALPMWLCPVQVVILPIAQRHTKEARNVQDALRKDGVRTEVDDRSETLQAKIRDNTLQKVPYLVIIGDKEVESGNKDNQIISVRTREGRDLGSMKLSDFLDKLKEEIDKKI